MTFHQADTVALSWLYGNVYSRFKNGLKNVKHSLPEGNKSPQRNFSGEIPLFTELRFYQKQYLNLS
jgi:hypothetical protein